MPIFDAKNDAGETVKRYDWPAKYMTPTDDMDEALRTWRKEAIQDRELFLDTQKLLAATGDREGAKMMKEFANFHLKLQRACTLILPWLAGPDANQEVVRPLLWPVDLAPELDEISFRLLLRFG